MSDSDRLGGGWSGYFKGGASMSDEPSSIRRHMWAANRHELLAIASRLLDMVDEARRERDEARAEVERLRGELQNIGDHLHCEPEMATTHISLIEAERDQARLDAVALWYCVGNDDCASPKQRLLDRVAAYRTEMQNNPAPTATKSKTPPTEAGGAGHTEST